MIYKKLFKGLLFGIALSFTYGEPCEEINAYAKSNNIELNCSNNDKLEVNVSNFLKEEAKEDFLQKFLKQFPNIEILYANGNDLSGKLIIPENSKLEILNVSDNNYITGELNIPNNSTLKKLFASHNKLTGSVIIPENSKLEELHVDDNNLSGQLIIPKNCNLISLHVADNELTGNITIPENLIEFYAQNNQLTGDIIIPENSKLEIFYAPQNKFNGKVVIPENYNLETVDIRDNELKGEITIPEYSNIIEFDARRNDVHVSCDPKIYDTDSHYCVRTTKKKSNYLLIGYISAIVICIIFLIVLKIIERKRKSSEKNKSNYNLIDNTNSQENLFKVGICYTASSNYVPNKEDEIAISVNDRISIIEIFYNDSAYGKNVNTQQSGVFPLSCLKNEAHNKEAESYKNAIQCLSVLLCLIILVPVVIIAFLYITVALSWRGN